MKRLNILVGGDFLLWVPEFFQSVKFTLKSGNLPRIKPFYRQPKRSSKKNDARNATCSTTGYHQVMHTVSRQNKLRSEAPLPEYFHI